MSLRCTAGSFRIEAVGGARGAADLRRGLAGPVATGEEAAVQRAPRDDAHAVLLARRQHRLLDAADEDRVRRLLDAEAFVAAALRGPLRLDDRLRGERRRSEVVHLALVHEIGQRRQRVVDVGTGLGPVHLVEVDASRCRAGAGCSRPRGTIHRRELPFSFGSWLIGACSFVASTTRVAATLQRLADDLLRLARRVHVGGVDEVDAGVERAVDDPDAVVVIRVAHRPEHHRAEAQRTDLDPGGSE